MVVVMMNERLKVGKVFKKSTCRRSLARSAEAAKEKKISSQTHSRNMGGISSRLPPLTPLSEGTPRCSCNCKFKEKLIPTSCGFRKEAEWGKGGSATTLEIHDHS